MTACTALSALFLRVAAILLPWKARWHQLSSLPRLVFEKGRATFAGR